MLSGAVRKAWWEQSILQVQFSLGVSNVHRRQLHSTDLNHLCHKPHVVILPVHTHLPWACECTQVEGGLQKGILCVLHRPVLSSRLHDEVFTKIYRATVQGKFSCSHFPVVRAVKWPCWSEAQSDDLQEARAVWLAILGISSWKATKSAALQDCLCCKMSSCPSLSKKRMDAALSS